MNRIDPAHTQANLVQKKYSERKIIEKLRSITVWQIELIGIEIAEKMRSNLGPVAKAKVAIQVMNAMNVDLNNRIMEKHLMTGRMAMQTHSLHFFSGPESLLFMKTAIEPIKAVITGSFSTPVEFLQNGKTFSVSNCGPTDFLQSIAGTMKIHLNETNTPENYSIHLSLSREVINDRSELVFCITEKSEGTVFSTTTFTAEELEKKFNSYTT